MVLSDLDLAAKFGWGKTSILLENETKVMRVVETNLIANIIRAEGGRSQYFLGLVDPGARQIFFKGLAGSLAENHAEMAGT